MKIPTNPDPLRDYIGLAPLPLAFERVLEAKIFSALPFERPVLDVGCGEGLFAKVLFHEPVDTGIDPDPRELKRAAELGAYHELIECWGHDIPKPDGAYRTIFSNSVLEHIPDVEPVLRESHRLLAPGGRMYVTVPSDRFEEYTAVNRVLAGVGLDGMSRRYRAFYNRFWRHYHCLSVDGWAELARRCGFEVADAYGYNPPGVCLLDDVLVPFALPGFVVKRLINRWTLVPSLRRVVLGPVASAMTGTLERGTRSDEGGLVFLSLRKPA